MTRVKIIATDWFERPVKMRLPFQFGSAEVRETAEAYASVVIEVDGKTIEGRSAQLMVPRWFDKRPEMSNTDTVTELRDVVRAAMEYAPGQTGTPISVSRDLRLDVLRSLKDVPGLAAGFGPALLEMAMIDALCRAKEVPFWRAAQSDLFGLADGAPKDVSAKTVTQSLSGIKAPKQIALRHTIGFDAPLRAGDLGPDAPGDGKPVALDQVIAQTGISGFKIKLKGDPEADLARLRAIAAVIDDVPGITVTLDANEQYAPDSFDDFLSRFSADEACARVFQATRFVEQPFAREIALETPVSSLLPLVIDESDSAEEVFPRALELGWSGTSIKSCKGVLRALLNRARAEVAGAVLSGEDLTCQPGLCWQQDTAMMAACGVRDVERNGHHFAGGMQGASEAERQLFLAAHPDIYTAPCDGVTLQIKGGYVALGSLDVPGFGCDQSALAGIDETQTLTHSRQL
ncbi:MAG: enolase C-terminal domain-like protein [Pseudomonadota bacterium]